MFYLTQIITTFQVVFQIKILLSTQPAFFESITQVLNKMFGVPINVIRNSTLLEFGCGNNIIFRYIPSYFIKTIWGMRVFHQFVEECDSAWELPVTRETLAEANVGGCYSGNVWVLTGSTAADTDMF
jgi:hypothetical protein